MQSPITRVGIDEVATYKALGEVVDKWVHRSYDPPPQNNPADYYPRPKSSYSLAKALQNCLSSRARSLYVIKDFKTHTVLDVVIRNDPSFPFTFDPDTNVVKLLVHLICDGISGTVPATLSIKGRETPRWSEQSNRWLLREPSGVFFCAAAY